MAKELTVLHNFTPDEKKMLVQALNKLDQSVSRFLTSAQKEEDEKSIASCKEKLATIATLKLKL